MQSPSAVSDCRPSAELSGAKRSRQQRCGVEFDPEEVMQSLGVDGSYMILGIDEAGRGPVIGPMVYTGAIISLAEHDQLVNLCHVADSKMLDEVHRLDALQRLQELKTFRSFTVVLSASEISHCMMGRHGLNLNTLSHDTAMKIVSQATLAAAGKLCAAYVDTVGSPETYESRLSGRFPHLRVTVSTKADSKYPIVSAASIVAKTTRDSAVASLGLDVGSGYPSDPRAMAWLRSHVHRFFVVRRSFDCVRQSWGPVAALAKDAAVCLPVTFEQDEINEKRKGLQKEVSGQKKLSFEEPPPRRAAVFTHMLKLRTICQLDDRTHD